jgi:hypothetical protein
LKTFLVKNEKSKSHRKHQKSSKSLEAIASRLNEKKNLRVSSLPTIVSTRFNEHSMKCERITKKLFHLPQDESACAKRKIFLSKCDELRRKKSKNRTVATNYSRNDIGERRNFLIIVINVFY